MEKFHKDYKQHLFREKANINIKIYFAFNIFYMIVKE